MAEDKIGAIQGVGAKSSASSVTSAGEAGASALAAGAKPISTFDQVSISTEAIEDLSAVSGAQGGSTPNLGALGQGAQPGMSSGGVLTTGGGFTSSQQPGMSVAGVFTSPRRDQ